MTAGLEGSYVGLGEEEVEGLLVGEGGYDCEGLIGGEECFDALCAARVEASIVGLVGVGFGGGGGAGGAHGQYSMFEGRSRAKIRTNTTHQGVGVKIRTPTGSLEGNFASVECFATEFFNSTDDESRLVKNTSLSKSSVLLQIRKSVHSVGSTSIVKDAKAGC